MDVSTDGSLQQYHYNDGVSRCMLSTDGSVTSTIVNIGGFVKSPGRQRHGYNPSMKEGECLSILKAAPREYYY